MKKIIFLAALVLFLIVVGVVPLLIGISFKNHYLDFIAATNQKNQIKIVVLDYKRGWFHSTATIQMTPVNTSDLLQRAPMLSPEQITSLTTVTFAQTISHGPIVMDKINNHPAMAMAAIENILHSSDIEKMLYGGTSKHGILMMNSVFNFSNECMNRIVLPAFQYNFPSKGSMNWQGLTTDIVFHLTRANEIDKVQTKTKIGTWVIKSDEPNWEGSFTLQPMTASSSTERQLVGLWTGESEIDIPGAVLITPTVTWFNVDRLAFKNKAGLAAKNLYQLSSTLTLNKLIVPSWSINTVSGFNFNINLTGLNAGELANLTRLVDAQPKTISSEENEKQFLQAIVRIITPTTRINITSGSDTSLGKFNLNALVYWPASVPVPQTPHDVVANSGAKIDIRMSIPLAKELVKVSASNIAARSARQVTVPAPVSASTPTLTPEANDAKNAFSQYIAGLMQTGKVSLPVSLQILAWWDQQLPADVFAVKVKQLGFELDTENGLVQTYSQFKKSTPAALPQAVPTQVATTPRVDQQQMKEQMQQLLVGNISATIDQWLTQGYIIQDGTDYVISITREAGVIKVNGKDLPPEIANMPGTGLGTVPSVAQ